MDIQIKSALIGAIIPTVGAFAIFFLGDYSTQSKLERDTVQILSEKFDSVEKDMSYEDALQAIFKENEQFKNEISTLKNQLSEQQDLIDQQNSEEEINTIIQNATEYRNVSNLAEALTLLKNSQAKSPYIESLYKQYSTEYIDILLKNADTLVSEKKYDEALELINENLNLVSDSNILNNKVKEINSNYPKTLSEIKVSASRYFEEINDRSIEDTVGNNHLSENLFELSAHDGEEKYGFATIYLGNQYTSISGIIAVSDESENDELDGHIEIYSKNGEKYNLLYESPVIKRASSPIDLSDLDLNLSEYEWLEIRYYNNRNYFFGIDRSLKILISNVMFFTE